MLPRYPIYIPSKGRWESRLTVKALDEIGVPYYVVVESHEAERYGAVIDPARLLVLPYSFPASNTELVRTRTWIWDHARRSGVERHWQLDDNIQGFYRLNRNLKTPVGDGTIFRVAEEFVDRYENVALAGFNYHMFAPRKAALPPYYLNTRIYSCTLIKNAIPYRHRGIYNDDTDISLRVLKDGWCTVLFNAFLCDKRPTMTVKGGNTPIYQGNGRLKMAESLVEQHPDVARVSWKWGRPQHHVDYSQFRANRLRRKPGIVVPDGVNNFGMVLQVKTGGRWERV